MLEIEQNKVDAIFRGLDQAKADKVKLNLLKIKLKYHKDAVRSLEKRAVKIKKDVSKHSLRALCDTYNVSVHFMLRMVEMNDKHED